jgi:5-methylcytosine-specific restriction endonuclease McrA
LRRPAAQQLIEPIAAERYKLQVTIDASVKNKLEQARNLLRHANPSGDLATVLSRALDLLIAEQLRHRFGVGARRKAKRPATPVTPSASPHIPHETRRAVLDRDGLACTWVDANGTRCNSRAWLELDHRHPRGKGGGSESENVRLLCRAHNLLAAEHAYGRAHIERAKAARRRHESTAPA